MYPPPGSFRYVLPKPSRDKIISTVKEDFCFTAHCISRFRSSFLFKCRFWKIFLMVFLVISTGHFSTIMVYPNMRGSLFLIHGKSTKKVTAPLSNEWKSHHRKVNNMFWNNTDISGNASLNFMHNGHSDIGLESTKVVHNISNASVKNKPVNLEIFNSNHSRIENWSIKQGPLSIATNSYKNRELNRLNSNRSTDKKLILQSNPPLVGTREKKSEMKLCPPIPPNLEGPFKVSLSNIPPLDVQEKAPSNFSLGGRYRPMECQARHKVAIIIPFRDRAAHLAVFLYNIHPMLQKQQLDYAIFIVEQAGKGKFNRAMLMNIGSIEALKLYPYDCFVFHDIDLIPEDDRNLYTCPEQPRHMSVAINTFKYRLPYNDIFGGVSAMTVQQFKTVNGFSNSFWGWGGEDDDMSNRIKFHGFYISRYPANIARYTMISHRKDRPNPLRYRVLNEGRKKFDKDGLSSVKYKILDISFKPLYTWLNVELIK